MAASVAQDRSQIEKRMHSNIVSHHSLDRTDKHAAKCPKTVGPADPWSIMRLNLWVNVPVIWILLARSLIVTLNVSQDVPELLVSLCWITMLDVRENRKGLDGKVACGRKRFDAAGQTVKRYSRRFTFTPNGKREFVPRDQVFPLIVVNCLLLQLKNK